MSGEKINPFGSLRRLLGNRRKSPRHRPGHGEGLLVGVKALASDESELLFARVRDLSEGGLSAAVEGDGGGLSALGESHALSLIIKLPAGTLAARGSLVYARPLDTGRAGGGYLIGARFTDISSVDLGRLRSYLMSLP